MPHYPDPEDLDGRRARRLGRRARSTSSPTASTTGRRSSRASAPTRRRRVRPSSGSRDHIDRLFAFAQLLAHRDALHRRGALPARCDDVVRVERARRAATSARSSTSATARWASTRCPASQRRRWRCGRGARTSATTASPTASASRSAPGPATTRGRCRPRPRRPGCTSTPRSPRWRPFAPATTRRCMLTTDGYLAGGHRREPLPRARRPHPHAADLGGRRARGHHRRLAS